MPPILAGRQYIPVSSSAGSDEFSDLADALIDSLGSQTPDDLAASHIPKLAPIGFDAQAVSGNEAYAELLVGATSPQVSDSPSRSTPDFCISLNASLIGEPVSQWSTESSQWSTESGASPADPDALRGATFRGHKDLNRARQLFEQALTAAQRSGDRRSTARVLHNFGSIAQETGDLYQARAFLEQALVTFREIGDRPAEADVLHNLGTIAQETGDLYQARAFIEQALVTFREIGDRRAEASALQNLGTIAQETGDLHQARAFIEQALVTFREIGDRRAEASALNNLGTIAQETGDLHQARTLYETALLTFQEIGDRSAAARAVHNLGIIAQQEGRFDQANQLLQWALATREETQDLAGYASTLSQLGALLTSAGSAAEAVTYNAASWRIRRRIGTQDIATDLELLAQQRTILGEELFKQLLDDALKTEALDLLKETNAEQGEG